MTDFGKAIFVLLWVLTSFIVGVLANDHIWRENCEQMGQTRSGGKVYECKLKEVRK